MYSVIKSLAVFVAFGITSARAEVCDVQPVSGAGAAWQIEITRNSHLILTGASSDAALRTQAAELLHRRGDPSELDTKADAFLREHAVAVAENEAALDQLLKALGSNHPPVNVGLPSADARGEDVQQAGQDPLMQYFVLTSYVKASEGYWSRVLLAAIGPVLYAKRMRPELFNNVRLVGLKSGAVPYDPNALSNGADSFFVTDPLGLEGVALQLVAACQSSYRTAGGKTLSVGARTQQNTAKAQAPAMAEPAPAAKTPAPHNSDEDDSADEPQVKSTRHGRHRHRSRTRHSSARRYDHKRGTVTWYTTDARGHRYKHVRGTHRH